MGQSDDDDSLYLLTCTSLYKAAPRLPHNPFVAELPAPGVGVPRLLLLPRRLAPHILLAARPHSSWPTITLCLLPFLSINPWRIFVNYIIHEVASRILQSNIRRPTYTYSSAVVCSAVHTQLSSTLSPAGFPCLVLGQFHRFQSPIPASRPPPSPEPTALWKLKDPQQFSYSCRLPFALTN